MTMPASESISLSGQQLALELSTPDHFLMRIRSPEWLWKSSRWLYAHRMHRFARLVKFVNYCLHKALLPAEAIVGQNLTLEHYAMGIVIHPNVTIGDDCRIYHHVTIAGESAIGGPHRVVIGDRVTIGVNAVILPRSNSSLTIGSDAVIGAGAVVVEDVDSNAIVAGVPAKLIKYKHQ